MLSKIKVPRPLTQDAYTACSDSFAGKLAQEQSVYNFCNRYSPQKAWPEVAKDNRMVFFGLSQYIRNVLVEPITYDEVVEAAHFMETAHCFGGPLPFPIEKWKQIVYDYRGRLPIKIEALAEGSTFFPNEPVIQVTSLVDGFGEFAAWCEAVMVGMVSIATARATLTRHWLERLREWVQHDQLTNDKTVLDTTARWMIHDFGMRASSCAEESELLGLAHLLSFHGTDSFNAAYLAFKYGANRPTGTSILALAHRNIQGHNSELQAFEALKDASNYTKNGMASYVADCYNYELALKKLVKLAKDNRNNIIVARPDSGPYIQNVIDVANTAYNAGLFTYDENGMVKPQNLKYIQGDSMTPTKVDDTLKELDSEGYTPTAWGIFGVGGYLRNSVTRDSLSSAYKLSAKGLKNEPVIKLSETKGKLSVPGPNSIARYPNVNDHALYPSVFLRDEVPSNGMYQVYYNGLEKNPFGEVCEESFSSLQERCINEFDKFLPVANNFKVLSDKILFLQDQTYRQYREYNEYANEVG